MIISRRDQTREAVLREATSWIGTPYRHQGWTKDVGCDCLGLVRGVWRSIYGTQPESPGTYAPDWAEAGSGDRLLAAAHRHLTELPQDQAQPGDLVLFRWRPDMLCKHAGILAAGNRMIHAYEGHAVMSSPMVRQWRRRIAATFSFPEIPERNI